MVIDNYANTSKFMGDGWIPSITGYDENNICIEVREYEEI